MLIGRRSESIVEYKYLLQMQNEMLIDRWAVDSVWALVALTDRVLLKGTSTYKFFAQSPIS